MNVVCAFIGIHNFEVKHVSYDRKIAGDTVTAQHVSSVPGDLECFATGITLNQTDKVWRYRAVTHQDASSMTGLQANADLRLHVSQLELDQLLTCQGDIELLPIQRVLSSGLPARLCCTQCTPGNAIARIIQTPKGPLQTLDIG
jgi:hypothetical protein